MMEIADKKLIAMSDIALVEMIGEFIKHNRLEQNKSQLQLAREAGINRSTLSQFENGTGSNLLTLIAILRALKLLSLLKVFLIEQKISPIQLARMEQSKRIRASRKPDGDSKPKSDW